MAQDEVPATSGAEAPTVEVETTGAGDPRPRASPPPTSPRAPTIRDVFGHPSAHAIVLELLLFQKFGVEWLGWEVETLERRISEDFPGAPLSEVNLEKIQACRALHLSDSFWREWQVFSPLVLALTGTIADFSILQLPTVVECLLAVDVARRVRNDVAWSDEVRRYLGVVHRHEGFLCPLPPLDFVELETGELAVDVRLVRELWPVVRKLGRVAKAPPIEAEQLRRMLEADRSLKEYQAELRAQLELVRHV